MDFYVSRFVVHSTSLPVLWVVVSSVTCCVLIFSDLAEPDQGYRHYSEQVVRLPECMYVECS